jgi:hypothetical protein
VRFVPRKKIQFETNQVSGVRGQGSGVRKNDDIWILGGRKDGWEQVVNVQMEFFVGEEI